MKNPRFTPLPGGFHVEHDRETLNKTDMNNNSKHPLTWFEDRVGSIIYRAPMFKHEEGRPAIPVKIKDRKHAKLLHDLQRGDRAPYVATPSEVTA